MKEATLRVDDRLDPENPRLPESVERTQHGMLQYVAQHGSIEELIESFVDNGYFEPERLIVIHEGGESVVVEGNRRLAALMVLMDLPVAEGFEHLAAGVLARHREQFESVPCLIVQSRSEVMKYLGYRHIGGLKTWSPEAKARFLKAMVEEALAEGVDDVFRAVGRQVGSNALGVRNPYLALAILEFAKREFGHDVSFVQYERFGVWIRCMNSKEIRDHIGLGNPRTMDEISAALTDMDADGLHEVVADLTPRGRQKAVLSDSRLVTDYGRVLASEKARSVLRRFDDLEVARQIIRQESLPDRVDRLVSALRVLVEELQGIDELVDADTLAASTNRLQGEARTLKLLADNLVPHA